MASARVEPNRIPAYPLWATVSFTLLALIILPVYWVEYGPGNFLWFSDIALFVTAYCLWTGNRLLYSMMAVGVLPLELVWTLDILTLGQLIGLAGYMFDAQYPLWLRALSFFHVPLLAILVWMLIRQGYDPRAFRAQIVLAWIVLPASWLLTAPDGPAGNVNWVHGFAAEAPEEGSSVTYLLAYMALLPILIYLPTHLVLHRLFGRRSAHNEADD